MAIRLAAAIAFLTAVGAFAGATACPLTSRARLPGTVVGVGDVDVLDALATAARNDCDTDQVTIPLARSWCARWNAMT